jgi:cytochrome c-type biogenesis protein CcmH/NrfG
MQERLPEAVLVYRQILQIMPGCTVAKMDLGSIYLSQRMFPESEFYLRAALQDEPQNARAHFMLGQILQATARVDEAAKALETFVSLERQRGLHPNEETLVKNVEGRIAAIRALSAQIAQQDQAR